MDIYFGVRNFGVGHIGRVIILGYPERSAMSARLRGQYYTMLIITTRSEQWRTKGTIERKEARGSVSWSSHQWTNLI